MSVTIVDNIRALYSTYQLFAGSKRVQNLMHITRFASGFMGIHGLLNDYGSTGRDISKVYEKLSSNHQRAFKIVDTMLSISMIVSAVQSTPAIIAWSWSVKTGFSTIPLACIFVGQSAQLNGYLATLAFLLKVPSILKFGYTTYNRLTLPKDQNDLGEKPTWSHLNYRDWLSAASTASNVFDKAMRTPTK